MEDSHSTPTRLAVDQEGVVSESSSDQKPSGPGRSDSEVAGACPQEIRESGDDRTNGLVEQPHEESSGSGGPEATDEGTGGKASVTESLVRPIDSSIEGEAKTSATRISLSDDLGCLGTDRQGPGRDRDPLDRSGSDAEEAVRTGRSPHVTEARSLLVIGSGNPETDAVDKGCSDSDAEEAVRIGQSPHVTEARSLLVTDAGYLEADAELYQDYLDKVMVADMEDVLLHDTGEGGDDCSDRSLPGLSDSSPMSRSSFDAKYLSLRHLDPLAGSELSDGEGDDKGHDLSSSLHGVSGSTIQGEASFLSLHGSSLQNVIVNAEVVASRLVNGHVSLGDRLVGVKAHAEYNIRVTSADGRVWMVQHRFREFMDLHWELVRFLEAVNRRRGCSVGQDFYSLPSEEQELPGTNGSTSSDIALDLRSNGHLGGDEDLDEFGNVNGDLGEEKHEEGSSVPSSVLPGHNEGKLPGQPRKGCPLLLPCEWSEAWKEGGQLVGTSSTATIERRRKLLHACLAATVAAGPPLSTCPALERFLCQDLMVLSPKSKALVRSAQSEPAQQSALLGAFSHLLGSSFQGVLGPVHQVGFPNGSSTRTHEPQATLGPGPNVALERELGSKSRVGADTSMAGAEKLQHQHHHHCPVRLIVHLHPLVFGDKRHASSQLASQRHLCEACARPLEEMASSRTASSSVLRTAGPATSAQALTGAIFSLSAQMPSAVTEAVLPVSAPRLCHYMGRLFCGACHSGERAVLPSLVLHRWDFAPQPVSQQAKAYLDSIHEQPLLSIAAINPALLQKVQALGHLNALRSQVATVYRSLAKGCPFREKTRRVLGRREYVLHPGSDGFYAMKELEDAAKGTFALFPDLLRQVGRRLRSHLEQCKCEACLNAGVSVCAAGHRCTATAACGVITSGVASIRCPACGAAYHEKCRKSLGHCLKCKELLKVGSHAAGGGSRTRTLNAKVAGTRPRTTQTSNQSWLPGWTRSSANVLQMQPFLGAPLE